MSFDLERPAFYLKRRGVIQLGRTHLIWTPDSAADGKGIRVPYGTITGYQVTAATAKKAMMKIDAADFPKGLKLDFRKEFADRDAVRDVLNQKLNTKDPRADGALNGNGAAKSDKDGTDAVNKIQQQVTLPKEERERRLAIFKNKEVRDLHLKLVHSGLISEEKFWDAMRWRYDQRGQKRKLWGDEEVGEVSGRKGMSSALGADAVDVDENDPSTNGSTKKIKMNMAKKHEIFVEFPAVERAFKALVPKKLSEVKFWENFFTSSMFRKDQASIGINKADELFAPFEAQEAALFDKEIHERGRALDPELNIDRFDDHRLPHVLGGQGENQQTLNIPGAQPSLHVPSSNLLLMRRVNRHGTLVVNQSAEETHGNTEHHSLEAWHEDEQQKQHPLPDLEKDEAGNFAPLTIKNQKVFFEAQAAKDPEETAEAASLTPQVRSLAEMTLQWVPDLERWTKPCDVSAATLNSILASMRHR